jgi:uncharacterized coiled-coil protein SlyX
VTKSLLGIGRENFNPVGVLCRFPEPPLLKYPPGKKKESILMKTKIRNSIRGLLVIPLVLACFALLPSVQATPDPSPRAGTGNVADGNGALANVTGAASFDSAVGNNALFSLTTGNNNACQGNSALFTANGSKNSAFGVLALRLNASGADNTAVGYRALNNILGSGNTALGSGAGRDQPSGSDNTFIGTNAGIDQTGGSNNLYLQIAGDTDNPAPSNRAYIGNVYNVSPASGGNRNVVIDVTGQLGAPVSSRRFKKDIAPMDKASEAILKLKPVTFHWKNGDTEAAKREIQFGLIAEDVAEVNPDWVLYEDGQPFSVRYEAVNVMLLNEFLKEHKKVEEQQASIAELKSTVALQQKGMEVLTAQLKEQASQIQKVSAQLEVNKTAPRTVATK